MPLRLRTPREIVDFVWIILDAASPDCRDFQQRWEDTTTGEVQRQLVLWFDRIHGGLAPHKMALSF
jgi:hypothetical protein